MVSSLLVSALLAAGALPGPTTVQPVTQDRDKATYDWAARHAAIVELNRTRRPGVVLIGDSITHFWGGAPRMGPVRGGSSWERYLAPRGAANLGFGWDRTENVLWRIRHGELDGLRPQACILLIGTNNLAVNSTPEIVLGVSAIVDEIRQRCPGVKVLVLSLPRGTSGDPLRAKSDELARALAMSRLGDANLNLSPLFVQADGSISRHLMSDLLHPTAEGYELIGVVIDRQLHDWGL